MYRNCQNGGSDDDEDNYDNEEDLDDSWMYPEGGQEDDNREG